MTKTLRQVLLLIASCCLVVLFWPEIWNGAGFVAGDATGYFLPQKVFLSAQLSNGTLPLWNNLVGHGYSFIGDSQIALWYPTTLLLYRYLDVNTAINATFLLHYVLAFALTWFCARRCGLRTAGALLAALVFVYGYFPSRVSLEWAITTGAWLPLGWGCLEAWLRTGRHRWLVVLILGATCQLLAGHFHYAFMMHVWLTVAAVLRLTVARRPTDRLTLPRWKTLLVLIACQFAAFPLAAVQLMPTWEMRSFSERDELPIRDIKYGRIPPWFLQQLVKPWSTYTQDPNSRGGTPTNMVAAQLYFGWLPLGLAGLGLYRVLRKRKRSLIVYASLSLVALVFAMGWVTQIYQYLPGFGWFTGVGRYSIMTALGVALLAGAGLDYIGLRFRVKRGRRVRGQISFGYKSLVFLVLAWSFVELRAVGRGSWPCPNPAYQIAFSRPLGSADDNSTPVAIAEASPLKKQLANYPTPPRLLAPLHNTITTLGIGVLPGYMGLKPQPYVNEETKIPDSWPHDQPPKPGQLDWLRKAGVTHLLFLEPEPLQAWKAAMGDDAGEVQMLGGDRYLALMFARFEPFYLLELSGTRGRLAWLDSSAGATAQLTTYEPDFVEANVDSPSGGTVVLTDFAYPGWHVYVDGTKAEPKTIEGKYRGVSVDAGQHSIRWEYKPNSVKYGAIVSLTTAVLLLALLVWLQLRMRTTNAGEPKAATSSV